MWRGGGECRGRETESPTPWRKPTSEAQGIKICMDSVNILQQVLKEAKKSNWDSFRLVLVCNCARNWAKTSGGGGGGGAVSCPQG